MHNKQRGTELNPPPLEGRQTQPDTELNSPPLEGWQAQPDGVVATIQKEVLGCKKPDKEVLCDPQKTTCHSRTTPP